MKIRESVPRKAFNVFNVAFMLLLLFVTVYPLAHIVFASFSNSNELLAHRGILLKPAGLSVQAYGKVFQNPMILQGYLNTILIVVTGVTLNIFMTSIGAYFLSRKGVMLQKPVLFYILFTMYFSGGLIPFYLTVKNLGLYNTYWALILPTAINTFNLIIMRTSFEGIPVSLEESATIDGANHFVVLFRIVMPLSLPVIAVMILYYGVGIWNAWFNAMIFIQDREKFPLQLILREILLQNDAGSMNFGVSAVDHQGVSETIKYAVIVVATAPVLCVYPFLQKYFVKGVMIGAVKG